MVTTTYMPPERATIRPGQTRLDESLLPEPYKKALKKLGYITVEQVISAAELVGARLSDYLNIDIRQLVANLPMNPVPAQIPFATKVAKYKFGVLLPQPVQATVPVIDLAASSHLPTIQSAPAPVAGAFGGTPNINLIPGMPPVRNQGNRGTCVAHSALASMEYEFGQKGQQLDLSEQFLYWNCKQHDGHPAEEGTFLGVATPLLVSDGCCLESVWGYNPDPQISNEGQGPPPAQAAIDAAQRKILRIKHLSPKSVTDIKDELAANHPVSISVVVYDYCWFPDEIRSSGDVTMPFPGDVSRKGHAVCIVGYEDLPGEPELGGGRFLIRNSWNSLWGVHCQYGTGYGTLPYAYLTTYGMEAYSIDQ